MPRAIKTGLRRVAVLVDQCPCHAGKSLYVNELVAGIRSLSGTRKAPPPQGGGARAPNESQSSPNGPLERDIVVEFFATAGGGGTGAAHAGLSGLATGGGVAVTATTTTAAWASSGAAAATEHLHFAADHLGRVAVTAFLVLPLAGSQPSLDVHLRTLAQILGRDLTEPAEQRDAMPFG